MLDLSTALARAPRLAGAILFACALAAGSIACSEEACIQKASAKGGVCPTRAEAGALFGGTCGFISSQDGFIQSVDSEPTDDGTLCCYAVTKQTSGGIVNCTRPAGGTAAGP